MRKDQLRTKCIILGCAIVVLFGLRGVQRDWHMRVRVNLAMHGLTRYELLPIPATDQGIPDLTMKSKGLVYQNGKLLGHVDVQGAFLPVGTKAEDRFERFKYSITAAWIITDVLPYGFLVLALLLVLLIYRGVRLKNSCSTKQNTI